MKNYEASINKNACNDSERWNDSVSPIGKMARGNIKRNRAGMQRMVEEVFFALIRFEIKGDELCDEVKNFITPDVLPVLFKLSKRHDLAHLIGDALDRNGLLPEKTEAKKRFLQERNMAIYRYEQQQYILEQICEALENKKIHFIPLKGSVLRQLYPEPWLRTSCDIDILVKKDELENAVRFLCDQVGCVSDKQPSVNEWSIFTPSGVHVELHYDLTEGDKYCKEVLSDIWQYTQSMQDGKYQLLLTDEAFYCYHIAHMVKHFENGGCGVRPFLDLWLFQVKVALDEKKRDYLLSLGGLLKFAQASNRLAAIWFDGAAKDEFSARMEKYIFSSGVFGLKENRVSMQQAKKGGRIRYILSRIFISGKEMKIKYPTLQKYPFLMPFYHIRRWGKPLVRKKAREKALGELSVSLSLEAEKQKSNAELLIQLGLK